MKRKEEIEKAAMQVAGVHPDWSNLDCFRMGFREGAKYADRTMLEKVCKFFEPRLIAFIGREDAKEVITEFRKAMKGGAE